MIYKTKSVVITNDDLRQWCKIFENKDVDITGATLVPGLCVWSYAHQDWDNWVAANINIRFSKPIYTGEIITIAGEVLKNTSCYCHRLLTITVDGELRQQAELKCMPLN